MNFGMKIVKVGGGYGTDFDFRNIRAPFATTRSFLNQIHQTKYCMVGSLA